MFVTPEFLKKEWQTLESTIKENKKHNNIVYVVSSDGVSDQPNIMKCF